MSHTNTASGHTYTEASAAATSLDPCDWKGFREQAHRMLDDMLGYIETIRERPVGRRFQMRRGRAFAKLFRRSQWPWPSFMKSS